MNNFNNDYAFILHHGWGCNQHYWKNLITELLKRNVKLEDILVCEGGYYNNLQSTTNYLGHNNQKATEGYLEFVKNFRQNPSEFIKRILGKIDLDENFCKEGNLNLDLLNRDLDLLNNNMTHLFDELTKTNYHIFASRDDHVVPFNIIGENFDDKKISFSLNNCGHSLGFVEYDWVLNEIFYSLSVYSSIKP